MSHHDDRGRGVPLPLAAALVGGAVLVGAIGSFSSFSPPPEDAGPMPTLSAAAPRRDAMGASVRGIDATVNEVRREGGMTYVTVRMDNHVHDLTDPTAELRTSLAGASPSTYEVEGTGHHVTLRISFEGEIGGTLRLEPVRGIGFSFEI